MPFVATVIKGEEEEWKIRCQASRVMKKEKEKPKNPVNFLNHIVLSD